MKCMQKSKNISGKKASANNLKLIGTRFEITSVSLNEYYRKTWKSGSIK